MTFFKFDIKHGYHHVNIDKAYHKYLSFSWSEDGVTKCYVFRMLVFGLASHNTICIHKSCKSPRGPLERMWHSYF